MGLLRTMPMAILVAALAAGHAEAVIEPTPPSADPCPWREVDEHLIEVHDSGGKSVIYRHSYTLADGGLVVVLSRFGAGLREPDPDLSDALMTFRREFVRARLDWMGREDHACRVAAQAAALRRPTASYIVLVRDHWAKAVAAGDVEDD